MNMFVMYYNNKYDVDGAKRITQINLNIIVKEIKEIRDIFDYKGKDIKLLLYKRTNN